NSHIYSRCYLFEIQTHMRTAVDATQGRTDEASRQSLRSMALSRACDHPDSIRIERRSDAVAAPRLDFVAVPVERDWFGVGMWESFHPLLCSRLVRRRQWDR